MKVLFLLTFLVVPFSHAPAQTQDEQNKFRLAQSFEQAGEYDRASQLYGELVRSDSVNFAYFTGLRRCYEQLKNYDAAIAITLRWLNQKPQDIDNMAALGALFYKAGNEARADSMWNVALSVAPKSVTNYSIVSMVQSDNRLFDKSIATYVRGRKEIGEPALFAGELAMLYSLMMDYADATREYITILSLNDRDIDLVESRLAGFTAKEEGLAAATKTFEEAIAKESKSIAFHRLLLWLYMEGKRFDKAFDVAKEIDESTHSFGAEMESFADLVFKEKAYDVAAKAYRYSIENYPMMPRLPEAKFGYARALEEMGATVDTLNALHSSSSGFLSESQPGYHGVMELYLSLSKEYPRSEISVQALYRAGLMQYKYYFDLNGAVQIFDSLLTLSFARQMEPAILETTGEINVVQGKLDKAAYRYSEILSSENALPEEKTRARFHLAEIQYFQCNFDSASKILDGIAQALADDESNDALLLLHFIRENRSGYVDALKEYSRASLLERQKKFSEAIPVLASIVQAFPDAPLADNALIKKAKLSTAIGQNSDALSSYQKLLNDYPKSILRDKAQFGIGDVYQFQLKEKEKAIQAYEELLAFYPNSLLVEQARKRIRELRGDVL
ncbi:MAG: tetratricopeptide repeat protein [Bacteroidota bacterium]